MNKRGFRFRYHFSRSVVGTLVFVVSVISMVFFFAPEPSDRGAEQTKLFEQSLDKDRQVVGVGAVSGTVPVRVAAISDERVREIVSQAPTPVRTEPLTEEQIIKILTNKPESFRIQPLMKTKADTPSEAGF